MADWEFRGDVLVDARRAAQLTQEELAAVAGVANELRIALREKGEEHPHARFIPSIQHPTPTSSPEQAPPPGVTRASSATFAARRKLEK